MTATTTTPGMTFGVPRGVSVTTHALVHVYHTEGHDVAALSGIDLVVDAGEMVGLLGPSGAGKSTLLAVVGGLFRPTAGKIYVGGAEISSADERELDRLHAREASLVLQGASRNLLPYLTPEQNVAFAQRSARRWIAEADLPTTDFLLDAVGVGRHASTPLAEITPGDRQLVALAVALATRPGLLLADEPTSQLAHHDRDTVLETLRTINTELGTTIIVVTHDPDVARWMPRTITIRDGRIGGEGRSGEEYAVVTADGFLPLPAHVLETLPAGTLVRLHLEDGEYRLQVEHRSESG